MSPDLARRLVPQRGWNEWVSFGHDISHRVPGGDLSGLLITLGLTGAYLVLLTRWWAARTAEARSGMPPACAVAGAAVVRAQRDPRRHPLAHHHLGPALTGDPEVIVMLHGLGATSAVWGAAAPRLARTRSVLLVDLLGFGASIRLGTRFTLADQADAVLRLLDHHQVPRAHLVGHSWGCVAAAAVMERAPERVTRLTLINPAAFDDVEQAKCRFANRSWLAEQTVSDTAAVRHVAGVMSLARPLLSRLAPRMEPDVPERVAREGVNHIYPAYRDALRSMWSANPLPAVLRAPTLPVTVVLGQQDQTVRMSDVLRLPPSPAVHVMVVEGTHGLPYEDPDRVVTAVQHEHPQRRRPR